MSADDPGQREVAYRLFAAEYDDANYSYSESDEERAPNYVVTPTGARVNRLFVVGVLTEVEPVNENMLRGRVADPTGAFVIYAGQYEPDEQAVLERTDPPAFVAVTGKANTFEPDDGDTVYTSIRPESINVVDAETRDRWTVQAAEQTLTRVHHAAAALSTGLAGEQLRETLADRDIDPALADGIVRALAHYGTTPSYLDGIRDLALDAARVVAGERDSARDLTVAPDDAGGVTAEDLLAVTPAPVDRPGDDAGTSAGTGSDDEPATGTDEPTSTDPESATGHGSERVTTDTASATSSADDGEGTTGANADETAEFTTGSTEFTSETDTSEFTLDSTTTDESTDTTTDPASDADTASEESTTTVGDPGEFDSEEFDLSTEVREEVQEEYGTEFRSGTEVDEPGEAGIETPDAEQTMADPESSSEPGGTQASSVTDTGTPTEPANGDTERGDGPGAGSDDTGPVGGAGPKSNTDETASVADESPRVASTESGDTSADAGAGGGESTEDSGVEDPQTAVLAVIEDLDDGNGADREAVVSETRERHGLTDDEVEEAVQSALMDGKCYEPGDGLLKSI